MSDVDPTPRAGGTVNTASTDGPDAVARLAESRERLRRAMAGPPREERAARSARTTSTGGSFGDSLSRTQIGGAVRRLFARVRTLPAAEVVVDAVDAWWAGHPLHTAGAVAADASKAYVQPYARRNPIALVVGSAVVGALFFLTRPWRWALRPVLLAGLLPQIVSQALRRAPVGAWVNIATALARRQSGVGRSTAKGRTPAGFPTSGTPHAPESAGPGSARPPPSPRP